MRHVNHGHVNNAGFINDQDYDARDSRPLLAVIGDSYIEALIIPYPLTLHGRLSQAVDRTRRVYSFGASGASLIDYLFYAEHAVRAYGARRFVVNVVSNDFDEMLLRYKHDPGYHYYAEAADGALAPVLIDYHPGAMRFLTHNSMLCRYLWHNVGTTPFGFRVRAALGSLIPGSGVPPGQPPLAVAGNSADSERIEMSKRAVREVLADFPIRTGVAPASILFLVDSVRVFDPPSLAAARTGYFGIMRSYFIEEALRRGFEVRDLQDGFARRHARDGADFQYPDDGHWNPTGHEEAANAVLESRLWRDFLAD